MAHCQPSLEISSFCAKLLTDRQTGKQTTTITYLLGDSSEKTISTEVPGGAPVREGSSEIRRESMMGNICETGGF